MAAASGNAIRTANGKRDRRIGTNTYTSFTIEAKTDSSFYVTALAEYRIAPGAIGITVLLATKRVS